MITAYIIFFLFSYISSILFPIFEKRKQVLYQQIYVKKIKVFREYILFLLEEFQCLVPLFLRPPWVGDSMECLFPE